MNYSRDIVKKGQGLRNLLQKSPRAEVSKTKLSNLLSNFKQDIIIDVVIELDTMKAWRKKEDANIMLAEYFPHCREKKHNYQCKPIASLESQHVPTKFKAIDEDRKVLYVTQWRPKAPRLGIPQDPLHNYSGNSQWKQLQLMTIRGVIKTLAKDVKLKEKGFLVFNNEAIELWKCS